jgi:hypothetical protein
MNEMMIIDWWKLCPRVRGFAFGYRFRLSSSKKDHLDPEFIRGWQEGVDLLFDERRAAAEKAAR